MEQRKCWEGCGRIPENGKIRCKECFDRKKTEVSSEENVPGTWTRRNNVATYNIVAGKKIPRNR